MSTNWKIPRLHIGLSVLVLFCAVPGSAQSVEVPINKEAGRLGWLTVTLRLDLGDELMFMVDTGSPITLLDSSLAPKLGRRLDSASFASQAGRRHDGGFYFAPRLYLGDVPLRTDAYVATYPCQKLSERSRQPIMGVLGVDCLRHYCVQLDFQAGKLRLYPPGALDSSGLGQAFPIVFSSRWQHFPPMFAAAGQNDGLPFVVAPGLVAGSRTNLLLDTGDNVDGAVEKGAIKGHWGTRLAHFFRRSRGLRVQQSEWAGNTYTNLITGVGKQANRMGLRFMARHLVTFDFPNHTLYLKQTSVGPLKGQQPKK